MRDTIRKRGRSRASGQVPRLAREYGLGLPTGSLGGSCIRSSLLVIACALPQSVSGYYNGPGNAGSS